jgi:hypothetical protein
MQPYDDIPSPPPFIPTAHRKCGIRSIAPLEINDETDEDYGLRPLLTDYSMAALDHYNKVRYTYLLEYYSHCMFIHSLIKLIVPSSSLLLGFGCKF